MVFLTCPRLPHTPTTSFRARPLVSNPHCQFERNRLCPTSTMLSRARSLVSCLHQVLLSPIARLTSQPCPFEPDRSSPTPTVSIRAQLLVSHPPSGPFEPDCLSPTQPCPFERDRSSPASTRPFRARPLLSHPTVSIRAQLLVSHPPLGPFEPDCSSLTQPCLFERNRSSPASTRLFRARPHQQTNLFRPQSQQTAALCGSLHSLYRYCGCVSQTHSVPKMYGEM